MQTHAPPAFRYPDKPFRQVTRAYLANIEALGTHRCDLKFDGWRCLARYEAGVFVYLSCSGKPLAVAAEVREPFEREVLMEVKGGGGPVLVDCELTGNRRAGEAKGLYVLDVLQLGDLELYGYTLDERRRVAEQLFPARLAPSVVSGFTRFYDFHQQYTPLAEGVVLKRRDSLIIGSTAGNAKNPHWCKCKWRAGESGTTPAG